LFGPFYGCPLNLPTRNVEDADLALIGNSHAQMYAPAIERALVKRGMHRLLVPASGCAPIVEYNISGECLAMTRANIDAVLALKRTKVVVIAFAWAKMKDNMVDPTGNAVGQLSWEQIRASLQATIDRFEKAGKQVILVGPIPRPGYDVASVVSREIAFGARSLSPLEQTRAEFDSQFGDAEAWTRNQPGGSIAILPSTKFCDARHCGFLVDGEPVYADDNHLSVYAMPLFSGPVRRGDRCGARQGRQRRSARAGALTSARTRRLTDRAILARRARRAG